MFLKIKFLKNFYSPLFAPFPKVESLATALVLTVSLLNYLNIILS